ncbi:MAG: hypothetical protein ACUBOA_08475 [Candidatus Loosdrechtia sp.]|uniref:hypothetical protein n=1 Tax=Candidatus Loosdrechtia sp. TaxID=3101272 RepID=UPI003A7AB51A|nr:MAG: hypothetical protein QY305_08735 [Candidatus Jettenia sp. AMX2]
MDDDSRFVTKMHFDALVEDYKAREQETLKHIELTHKAFHVSIGIAGFLIAAIPFIEEKRPLLIGIFPFFLYLSALTQLRYMWTVAVHDRYLVKVLVPDIKDLFGSIPTSNVQRYEKLMFWKTGYCARVYAENWHDLIIENSRLFFPILMGILFFSIFVWSNYNQLFLCHSYSLYINALSLGIFLANLVFIAYVPIKACVLYKFIKKTFEVTTQVV